MKRPRSLTASVATSMMRLAAVSASAAGSAHTVRVASEAMIRSYPLVQLSLAFQCFEVSNMMSFFRHESFSQGSPRGCQIGQEPERLQREQGGAPAGRLGLERPRHRPSDRIRDDLRPGARVSEGRARG